MKLEFSRPLAAARVPAKGSHEKIAATPAECAALAARLCVPAFHTFTANLHVSRWRGGGLKVTGTVTADADWVSVISLELFRSAASYDVERFFLPPGPADDEADTIVAGFIDVGEIAAETFALEADPYPRRSDEVFAGFDSGGPSGATVSPVVPFVKDTKKSV